MKIGFFPKINTTNYTKMNTKNEIRIIIWELVLRRKNPEFNTPKTRINDSQMLVSYKRSKMDENELEFEPSKEDLKSLRDWIIKSLHIVQDYDDKFLAAFVRGCKGSLQKTKNVLEAFNSLRQRYPEMIKNYDPLDQRLVDNLSQAVTFPLPKKTSDGSNVYMSFLRDDEGFEKDPYKAHNAAFFNYWLLSLYIYLWTNDFGSGKWTIIMDCKGTTMIHAREFTPILLKHALEMMQKALPIRIQAVHLLNVPSFLGYAYNLVKSFAKQKISDRIYFHASMESFYSKFPKELLPKEYGGNEESALLIHELWHKKLMGFRTRFLEEEHKMRSLDSIRPKTDDINEMVGTFKSLNVD